MKKNILHVVLYGCETWSLTLRENHRLWVFENRVLRRVFGLKRDEVMGCWRKLHNAELQNLHSLPGVIRFMMSRRMRWARSVSTNWDKRNACRILVVNPERKKPLRK
jgi:hypothetical protein